METLDQTGNNQISERAIRNLTSSAVWIIISSCVSLIVGLYVLYIAFRAMSIPYASGQGGVMLIIALIWIALAVVGLNYGIGLSTIKIYTPEAFEKASIKHNAYWIFVGIVYIIWFLLFMMSIAGGGGRMFRL